MTSPGLRRHLPVNMTGPDLSDRPPPWRMRTDGVQRVRCQKWRTTDYHRWIACHIYICRSLPIQTKVAYLQSTNWEIIFHISKETATPAPLPVILQFTKDGKDDLEYLESPAATWWQRIGKRLRWHRQTKERLLIARRCGKAMSPNALPEDVEGLR